MSGRSWWQVRTRAGVVYLPTDEGDRLAEAAMAYRIEDGRLMAWRGTDIDGEEVVISYDDIITIEHSSPKGRARQDDPEGLTEECRTRAIETSRRPWTAASEDFEP